MKLSTLTALVVLLALASAVHAAELKVATVLKRNAYQTNEQVVFVVGRAAAGDGEIMLALNSSDGSSATFSYPVSRALEFIKVNAALLRPGAYSVEISEAGATAKTNIEVVSHVRRTSYKLVNWGRAKGAQQLWEGEDCFGFNVFYGHYADDGDSNFIRAKVDVMPCCVMSGGHQMDLRMECDWSDPYVLQGGTQRAVRSAMMERVNGNVTGIHFYDEPGLSWWKNPETGDTTPHDMPPQVRSFESAFGKKPPQSWKLDPAKAGDVNSWRHWAVWKLGFMDAAWKDAQFGVSYVKPDMLSLTQSQYGFSAFTDGYYFNVVRSLPIVSGHGGYHDWGPGFYHPSYTVEMARARDLTRDCWYLPCWYGNTTNDEFRLEQYLSFQTGIEGLISPPDLEPAVNPSARQGIVESNLLMGRLGTVFTTMPATQPPVAMLFSLSDMIDGQIKDMKKAYVHDFPQGQCAPMVYIAGKLLQHSFLPVTDEDVVDGTLAANQKAIVLGAINYLDPAVVKGLEDFISAGGLVMKTADSKVEVKGAVDLGITAMLDPAMVKKLVEEKKPVTVGMYLDKARPLAKAIKAVLEKAGIKPVFDCDADGIAASRQAEGEVEYIFAANATYDAAAGGMNSMKGASANIALDGDAMPVYDAVRGGAVPEFKGGTKGEIKFGPGQMRVFARTARPIGGVAVSAPVVSRDTLLADKPIRLCIAASVLDEKGGIISGSIPLRIRVSDPLGTVRYDLYRATKLGVLSLELPLAANDPAGDWKLSVEELLCGKAGTVQFKYNPAAKCGMLAGTIRRAIMFDNEQDNIFRFTRVHQDVTVVKGAGSYDAAAERISKALLPWGVRCRIVNAADVAKPRALSELEAKTWCGMQYAGSGQIKPGDANPPVIAGFALQGPSILIGNPDDNPLIKFVAEQKFLPYAPDKAAFPGVGRGYVAWQRDAIGKCQESVTLIAYDEEGMSEAVGSFYEAAAGIEPLTPWTLPSANSVAPAKSAANVPSPEMTWSLVLPDRVVAISETNGTIAAQTYDGTVSEITPQGKLSSQKSAEVKMTAEVKAPEVKDAPPTKMVKFVAEGNGVKAVVYWGGTIEIRDASNAVKSSVRLVQDITAAAWSGGMLVAGDADGRLMAFKY